ncbi:hypothetical protein M0804_002675 [Polistes exclamans]|nr:hypothetical protein M0804_002675 [Polistes exclamans]
MQHIYTFKPASKQASQQASQPTHLLSKTHALNSAAARDSPNVTSIFDHGLSESFWLTQTHPRQALTTFHNRDASYRRWVDRYNMIVSIIVCDFEQLDGPRSNESFGKTFLWDVLPNVQTIQTRKRSEAMETWKVDDGGASGGVR